MLAIGILALIGGLLYVAVCLASGSRVAGSLLAVAWIAVAHGTWTVVSHHWFTTAASMASAVGLLIAVEGPRRGRTAFAAGLFAGVAAMITPTRGALLCLAVAASLSGLRRFRSRLAHAVAGITAFPVLMVLYLAACGALTASFNDVIRYAGSHYVTIQPVPFGSFVIAGQESAVAFFPVTLALAALAGVALWRMPLYRASLTLAIVGVLGTYPRPDIVHINFTLPLVAPLFALVITELLRRVQHPLRTFLSAALVALCLVSIGGALGRWVALVTASLRTTSLRTIVTARGPIVRFRGQRTDDMAALVAQIDAVPSRDPFFFYPYCPLLPYLTGRRHVASVDVMTPGYTTPAVFRETCRRVVSEAQWVVVDRYWMNSKVLQAVFPSVPDPDPRERHEFEVALRLAFDATVHRSSNFELWRRTTNASVALCDRIPN